MVRKTLCFGVDCVIEVSDDRPFAALYLLYAKLEEDHGLARHAMGVYDRATTAVLPEEQYEVRWRL